MPPFAVTKTCSECPFLLASRLGKFPASRYLELADTCKPGLVASIFACHMSGEGKERACAGMLKVCGWDSNMVRLAALTGRVDLEAIEATGPLYVSYRALAIANGCDPEAPEFDGLPD